MTKFIRAFCTAMLLASATIPAVGSVAMVTRLTGKAEARAAGATDWKPLRLMKRLDAGDVVRCAPGSEATITVFASAQACTVAGGTTVALDDSGVKGAQKVAGLHGSGVQVARAMVGDRPGGFFARPAQAHQRLNPQYSGWLAEGERHFEWAAIPRAASYTFTLFDQHDNVVWSERAISPKSDYPAALPFFTLRRPYVWRLVPFGESGKPLPETRWGIVTFLSEKDAAQLTADAKELEAQVKADNDVTLLVLLAELYRSYGVLEKTLETLERPELQMQAGIADAQTEAYGDISPYAQVLRTPIINPVP